MANAGKIRSEGDEFGPRDGFVKPRPFTLSIRGANLVLVLLVTLSSIVLLINAGLRDFREGIEEAKRDSAKLVFNLASEFNVLVNSTRELGEVLSQLPEVQQRDASKVEPLLAKLIARNPVYANIVLLDRAGNAWASGIPTRGRKFSMADRRYFIEAMSTGRFSAGEYTVGKTSSIPVLSFGVPIIGPKGKPDGCIAIGFDLGHFKRTYEKVLHPSDASFILLDHKGTIIFRLQDPEKYIGTPYPRDEFKAMQAGPPEKTDIGMGIDGIRRVRSYVKLTLREGDPPYLYARAGMPYDPIASESLKRLTGKLLILVLVMAFAVFLLWFIGRRFILAPVTALNDAITRVSKGDFDVRISGLMRASELRKVEPAFDAMVSALSGNITERERSRKALEAEVAARQLKEEALRESEERYAGLVEGTQDLIIRVDSGGRIAFVNRTSGNVFGLPPDECVGRQVFDFVHPEDKARTMEWFRECMASRAVEGSIENRQIGIGGRVHPMQWRSTFRYDGQGNLVSVDSIARDITEGNRAEEELRRSENRFATIFRASPVCISLTRLSDGHFLDINDAFVRLFGYDREEIIGRNPLVLDMWANPDDRARMVGILRERGRVDGFETTFRAKSGEIRNVIVISEVIDVAGEQYILGLTLDITDRKRAEEEKAKLEAQLQQAMKMEAVGRLAGGVAHDFNNLLTVITGYSELLLQKIGKGSPMYGEVEEIRRAGDRAASLTQQLLAFSRKQILEP